MDLKELAKEVFDNNDEKENTKKYVEQIIDIFITSNLQNEKPILGLKIELQLETLKVAVAYSYEDIGYDKFFKEDEIPKNYVKSIEAVRKFNSENAERKYLIYIIRYFKKHLSEDFLVCTAKTIEVRRGINLQNKSLK